MTGKGGVHLSNQQQQSAAIHMQCSLPKLAFHSEVHSSGTIPHHNSLLCKDSTVLNIHNQHNLLENVKVTIYC